MTGNSRAGILAETLDRATGSLLEHGRSPSRKTGELDNRGSHFYLALYWAQELAAQDADTSLAEAFRPLAERLASEQEGIVGELAAVQGSSVEIGGYYHPDDSLVNAAMRPSDAFNAAIADLRSDR
jgi:isocitrate dehydrogenase